MDIENSKAQMKKGILEYCILSIISRGEVYASDILEEMKSSSLLVVEGTIYPLLSRLKNDAYWQLSHCSRSIGSTGTA
jgi:PadR family transcriptional regulator PadR